MYAGNQHCPPSWIEANYLSGPKWFLGRPLRKVLRSVAHVGPGAGLRARLPENHRRGARSTPLIGSCFTEADRSALRAGAPRLHEREVAYDRLANGPGRLVA